MTNNKPNFFQCSGVKPLLVVCFFVLAALESQAQTITSTVAGGDWSLGTTWIGGTVPTAANSTSIVIDGPVSVSSTLANVDQITINATGSITIGNAGTLPLINDGTAAADLIISGGSLAVNAGGILTCAQGAIFSGNTALNTTFASGAEYRHLYTTSEGALPIASWNVNSTVRLMGYTSGFGAFMSTTWSQTFGNFTIDCSGLLAGINFSGLLQNVDGNLTLTNTNGRPITLVTSAFPSVTIDGSLTISGNSVLTFSPTTTAVTYNIGGSFNYSATANNSIASLGNCTVNIALNFTMNSPAVSPIALSLSSGSSNSIGTLDIKGNFTFLAGIIREGNTGAGKGVIRFSGTTLQTYSKTGGTLPLINASETIDWIFNQGSIVDLGTSFIGSGSGSLTTVNGTILVGSTDANGAIQSAGTILGNIRTPVVGRTYQSTAPAATIIYNGGGAQFLGAGHPSSASINLIINNNSGVSQIATTSHLVGNLTLTLGNLNITNAGANSLIVGGNLALNGGNLNLGVSSSLTLNGNSSNSVSNFISPNALSNITINGTGDFGVFPFPAGLISFNNLVLNRTPLGIVTFDNDVNIIGNTTLTNGNLVFNDRSLSLVGSFTSGVTNGLSGNSLSTLQITGNGAFGTLRFAAGGNTVGTLTLNRTGGSVILGSQLTIADALNLLNGSLDNTVGITIGDGADVIRDANASLLTNRMSNSGGESYNLTYTGTATPLTTGLELPDPFETEDLNNLTINGAVDLNQDLTINGTVSLDAEILAGGANLITMNGPSWLDNDGDFAPGTGAVVFTGTTSVDGTSTPQLGTVQLTDVANVTLPAVNVQISGDIDVIAGGIIQSSGTVVLNGAVDQNVSLESNTLTSITVSKTGDTDVQLLSPMNITGLLDVQSGNTDFNSNGFLTILSSDDNNLNVQNIGVAPLLFGATVSGGVTVQRYMSGEGRIWRYISSPVQGATVNDFMNDDFPVTGPFQDPSSGPGLISANPSFYYYDEEPLSTDLQIGWTTYPLTGNLSTASPLTPGVGYSAFIRESLNPTTWDLAGPINQGTMGLPVEYHSGGAAPANVAADGWNLVGNPYPSTIFWSDAGWNKTNINAAIYVRDSGAGIDAFQTWDGEIGDPFSGLIALGQGFWVQTNGADPVLEITENAKSISNGSFLRTSTYDYMQLVLTKDTYTDRAYYRQRNLATAGRDKFDALKMTNGYFTLSIKSTDNFKMAINAVDQIPCGQTIPLDLSFAKNANGTFVKSPSGSYKLSLNQFGLFGSNQIEVYDKFTNTRQIFQPDQAYVFSITTNSQSYRADRFELKFIERVPGGSLSLAGTGIICSEASTAVIIQNAEADVEYQAFVNDLPVSELKAGIGQNLSLSILNDSLEAGQTVVHVKAFNGCGSYELVNTFTISKENNYPVTAFASTQACQHGSVKLTVNGAPSNGTYKWYESENSTQSISEGASSEFITPELNKPKTYYVSIINSLGCEGPKVPVRANIVNYDEVEITSPAVNELKSNYAEGNTWLFNGIEMVEKTQNIDITETGNYRVEVTINGCTTSAEIDYVVTGIEEASSLSFSVYPNPVSDVLTIKGDIDPTTVKMLNSLGAPVGLHWINLDERKLSMKEIAAGIYYISAREGNKSKTLKVIKK